MALSIHARVGMLEDAFEQVQVQIKQIRDQQAQLRELFYSEGNKGLRELRQEVDEMDHRVNRIGAVIEKQVWRTSTNGEPTGNEGSGKARGRKNSKRPKAKS